MKAVVDVRSGSFWLPTASREEAAALKSSAVMLFNGGVLMYRFASAAAEQ